MKVIGFIIVAVVSYTLLSFACSPIVDWIEFKIYYPLKYQNKYKPRIWACCLSLLFFILLYGLFCEIKHEGIVIIIGAILGCIASIITNVINIKTPKWPMGLITDEKDKIEYLELEEKISQTNDYFLKEEYKKRQTEFLDKYTHKQ